MRKACRLFSRTVCKRGAGAGALLLLVAISGCQHAPVQVDAETLCDAFTLVDREDRQPLDAFAWGVRTADGQLLEGMTAADGKIRLPCVLVQAGVTLEYSQQTRLGL